MNNNEEKNQKIKLFAILLLLVTLIILVNMLKDYRNKDQIWNYSEITSGMDVISEGSIINDRETYYTLEDIIVRFLLANSEGTVDNLQSNNINYEATYEDYYSILVDDYKDYLSKHKFQEISNNFAKKFITISAEGYKYLNIDNIIREIFFYGENKYLCLLEGNNGNLAFFGVQLYENNNSYKIFYVE